MRFLVASKLWFAQHSSVSTQAVNQSHTRRESLINSGQSDRSVFYWEIWWSDNRKRIIRARKESTKHHRDQVEVARNKKAESDFTARKSVLGFLGFGEPRSGEASCGTSDYDLVKLVFGEEKEIRILRRRTRRSAHPEKTSSFRFRKCKTRRENSFRKSGLDRRQHVELHRSGEPLRGAPEHSTVGHGRARRSAHTEIRHGRRDRQPRQVRLRRAPATRVIWIY